jgi:hypothetical protein
MLRGSPIIGRKIVPSTMVGVGMMVMMQVPSERRRWCRNRPRLVLFAVYSSLLSALNATSPMYQKKKKKKLR